MGKGKNVTVKVPTVRAELEALPPKIVTVKNFWRWNWKYIVPIWILAVANELIGCFLPWPPIFRAVFSMSLFFLGALGITKHTITEITN